MDIEYRFIEHLKEYSVEENGFNYYMPCSYVLRLLSYCKETEDQECCPVENWYRNLKEIEKRVVAKKPKDEEKLSSIW
ncbi:MAG: hypothetical protein JWQ40_4259 [Segetibacter sp.]|jgi:hypothetical protein|nr:hypothetical protein [Segetibacter sp.]